MEITPLDAASPDAVWDVLASTVRPGPVLEVDVADANNRVLAADVRAGFDFPPFARAMMDGYAVRASDAADNPVRLRVTETIRAGVAPATPVRPGFAQRVNTGAPLPQGADAVVPVEHCRRTDDDAITFDGVPTPGQHVERRAAVVPADGLVARAGTRVSAGGLAAIVSAGHTRVKVFRRPAAAFLTTGDELIAAGDARGAAQIYDSNSVALRRLIEGAHAEAVPLGHSADDSARLRPLLELGLTRDLLCVAGGMSKGTHDLVPAWLERLGVRWLVRSLHMKPGKPMRIGLTPNGGWVIGLPGNPVSCAVCFLLFARAILDGLEGVTIRRPPHLRGALEAAMPANGARPLYQPGTWDVGGDGAPRAAPLVWRGSGDPFGMAVATALIRRPANAPPATTGESVFFIPLDVPR